MSLSNSDIFDLVCIVITMITINDKFVPGSKIVVWKNLNNLVCRLINVYLHVCICFVAGLTLFLLRYTWISEHKG